MRIQTIQLWLFFGLLSCKTIHTESKRGATGLTGPKGEQGSQGIAGLDGKSCASTQKPEGIEITCEGQPSVLIPFAKDGSKGESGEPGVSCSVANAGAEGITLRCPDANKPGEFKEVKVTNGKDGSSCKVEYTSSSRTEINCAGQLFTIHAGSQGARGEQGPVGPTGNTGPAGQDNYTSTLNSATMSPMSPGNKFFVCKGTYLSNDRNYGYRTYYTEVFADGQKIASKLDNTGDASDKGSITINVPNRIAYNISGKKVSCTIGLYAENVYEFRGKALTSKAESAPVEVIEDGSVLPSAQDYTFENPTVAAENKLNFKIVRNTSGTSKEGYCSGSITGKTAFISKEGKPLTYDHSSTFGFDVGDISKGLDVQVIKYYESTLLPSGTFVFSFTCTGDTFEKGKPVKVQTLDSL